MTRYTVTAERSGRWWALQCVEVPGALSQVARLDQADQIREAIAFVAGVDEDSVEIDVQPAIPASVAMHMEAAEALRAQSDRTRSAAAFEVREAAGELADTGLTVRDIGTVLAVSYQRAQQLVAERREMTHAPDEQMAANVRRMVTAVLQGAALRPEDSRESIVVMRTADGQATVVRGAAAERLFSGSRPAKQPALPSQSESVV